MNDQILFDPSRMPERDELGLAWHPDLDDPRWQHPEWEEYLNEQAFSAASLEMRRVEMVEDLPANHPLVNAWCANEYLELSAWKPSLPSGEGWWLIAIFESDEGPCALYVRDANRGHA